MIEPTRNDLHRWVEHRLEDGTVVTGILRAIGRHHVFVAFGTENVRVACRPEDLAWFGARTENVRVAFRPEDLAWFGARAENPGAAAARWRFYREGFEIVEIDSHHWLVSLRPLPNQLGSFFAAFFWPATGHWRRCGTVGSGCGPGPLIEELRARRNPSAGIRRAWRRS